jgi:glucose/arabinose dehydrogenase
MKVILVGALMALAISAAGAQTRNRAVPPPTAEQLIANAGQPLCADEDGLAAILFAGVMKDSNPEMSDKLLKSATGCEFLPAGSKLEVIERHPSGASFMRVMKVKATPPRRRPIVGFTVEVDPN